MMWAFIKERKRDYPQLIHAHAPEKENTKCPVCFWKWRAVGREKCKEQNSIPIPVGLPVSLLFWCMFGWGSVHCDQNHGTKMWFQRLSPFFSGTFISASSFWISKTYHGLMLPLPFSWPTHSRVTSHLTTACCRRQSTGINDIYNCNCLSGLGLLEGRAGWVSDSFLLLQITSEHCFCPSQGKKPYRIPFSLPKTVKKQVSPSGSSVT